LNPPSAAFAHEKGKDFALLIGGKRDAA